MNEQEKAETVNRLKANRRNINFVNSNCNPTIGIKATLREIKSAYGLIIDDLETPENGVVIIDNPKPVWMPRMVCTVVDLPFNVGDWYSWEELDQFAIGLSLAGCDGVRIFGTSWEPYIEPFRKMNESGEYSFFKRNPIWDATLIRFKELLHQYHMFLYVDLNDNCSHKSDWNPFTTTRHNFSKYFYGYTNMVKTNRIDEETEEVIKINEVDFAIEYWEDRIMDCLDPDKDIVGLGNELRSPVEGDVSERKVWAEKWGVARAKHIFDRGFKQPIPFSGSTITAQKLHGFISAEEHPELGWTYRTSCNQIHGLGTWEHVDNWAGEGISQRRVFSFDDDGVGTNPGSQVPEGQRGYCEIRPDGSTYACTADTPTRIATVRRFIDTIKDRTYCFSIGFLPRSILYKNKTVLSRFDKDVDAEIYTRIAADLWDVDIRRTRA